MPEIKQYIRTMLAQDYARLTPLQLIQKIKIRWPDIHPMEIRAVIRQMVLDGELVYSQHCGTSHLQMSGVGIVPLPMQHAPMLNGHGAGVSGAATVVYIEPGLSFGAGDHPTTHLSLEALVWVSHLLNTGGSKDKASALDVGTGSGVLAVAAVLLGFGRSIGIDIDPYACFEAKRNAARNVVHDKAFWLAGSLDAVGEFPHEVVMANLRPPTLVSLMPRMASLLKKGGYCILSGFRPDEADAVGSAIPESMVLIRFLQNRGWAAIVGRRV